MYSRRNFVAITYAEIYVIPYPLPVTGRHLWYVTHPVVGECSHCALPCFWDLKIVFFPGSSLISHSYRDNLVAFVCKPPFWICVGVTYNLRHIRHHRKCACAPLPVGENGNQKFQSVPEHAAFAAPRRLTFQKSGHCSMDNKRFKRSQLSQVVLSYGLLIFLHTLWIVFIINWWTTIICIALMYFTTIRFIDLWLSQSRNTHTIAWSV